MMKIEKFENADRTKGLAEQHINSTLYWVYKSSQEAGNDRIDFNEVIWDYDIDPILEVMRENGIKEFTISSTFSSLIETFAEFEKRGCHMNGLTEVNARYMDWKTGEHARIPAIVMVL